MRMHRGPLCFTCDVSRDVNETLQSETETFQNFLETEIFDFGFETEIETTTFKTETETFLLTSINEVRLVLGWVTMSRFSSQ